MTSVILRIRGVLAEGAWIAFGQIVAIVGSLASVRLLTEMLDPAVYGELALAMTAATLVNQTAFGPVGNGVARFFAPAAERGVLKSYFAAVKLLVARTGAVVAMVSVLVVAGLLAFTGPGWAELGAAAAVFAVVAGLNSILSALQSAARRRSVVALHQGAEPWLRLLCAAAAVACLGATSVVAQFGFSVAALLVLLSQSRYLKHLLHSDFASAGAIKPPDEWVKLLWDFAWPITVFGVFTWMQLVSDRWALEHFASVQEVGRYVALFQIGFYPMSLASGMVMQLIVPIVYQRAGDAKDDARNAGVRQLNWTVAKATLLLTAVAVLVAFAFHTQFFGWFVARQYREVSALLPWMILAGGLQAAAQTVALNLMSQMETRRMLVAKIVTALVGTLLNCGGAYYFGTAGVVAAANLFSIALFLWMAHLSKNSPKASSV